MPVLGLSCSSFRSGFRSCPMHWRSSAAQLQEWMPAPRGTWLFAIWCRRQCACVVTCGFVLYVGCALARQRQRNARNERQKAARDELVFGTLLRQPGVRLRRYVVAAAAAQPGKSASAALPATTTARAGDDTRKRFAYKRRKSPGCPVCASGARLAPSIVPGSRILAK